MAVSGFHNNGRERVELSCYRTFKHAYSVALIPPIPASWFAPIKLPAIQWVTIWRTELNFWLSVETPFNKRQHFCFDKIMWQGCVKSRKIERRYLKTLKVSQPQLFDDFRRVFDGPKIIHITIAKGSFTVLYNMIFDYCESGCYMLR